MAQRSVKHSARDATATNDKLITVYAERSGSSQRRTGLHHTLHSAVCTWHVPRSVARRSVLCQSWAGNNGYHANASLQLR